MVCWGVTEHAVPDVWQPVIEVHALQVGAFAVLGARGAALLGLAHVRPPTRTPALVSVELVP